jgi:hypothetical protein
MQIPIELGQRVLARTIRQAGSVGAAAHALDIHPILLSAYLEGKREIPAALFMPMVDLATNGDARKVMRGAGWLLDLDSNQGPAD